VLAPWAAWNARTHGRQAGRSRSAGGVEKVPGHAGQRGRDVIRRRLDVHADQLLDVVAAEQGHVHQEQQPIKPRWTARGPRPVDDDDPSAWTQEQVVCADVGVNKVVRRVPNAGTTRGIVDVWR
jgi:hypothetical protein